MGLDPQRFLNSRNFQQNCQLQCEELQECFYRKHNSYIKHFLIRPTAFEINTLDLRNVCRSILFSNFPQTRQFYQRQCLILFCRKLSQQYVSFTELTYPINNFQNRSVELVYPAFFRFAKFLAKLSVTKREALELFLYKIRSTIFEIQMLDFYPTYFKFFINNNGVLLQILTVLFIANKQQRLTFTSKSRETSSQNVIFLMQ